MARRALDLTVRALCRLSLELSLQMTACTTGLVGNHKANRARDSDANNDEGNRYDQSSGRNPHARSSE